MHLLRFRSRENNTMFPNRSGSVTDHHNRQEAEQPIVNVVGERVALGPLRRDLLGVYQRWFNDFGTLRTLDRQLKPVTMDQVASWYDHRAANNRIEPVVIFTIFERETGRPLGNTALENVDLRDRTAEFGIFIGESDCRGKGYGTEATALMLDYAFTALGLHNVMLRAFEYNHAGLGAYRKAGFVEIGRRRQARLMNGQWWDEIYMECLASEFTSPVLSSVFVPDAPRPE